MGKHAEDILFTLLNNVDEDNLYQEEVQMEEHVQDVASHQHPNNVRMNVGWRDLGVMQELLEER